MIVSRLLLLVFLFNCSFLSTAQDIAYERDPYKNTTATYEELIDFYKNIDDKYEQAKLVEIGPSDIGKPLHLLVLSADGDFEPLNAKQKNKIVLLVNNGIHPGEPEGIDVSMMFVRDILAQGKMPENVIICIIPVYNIAGMLNRGVSRVNQNGPESYGFRGSRQNYDLNRDFIKTDSRNSRLFQQIFNTWDPDIFFDTHASNGADYQYIMTLITTQKDKLNPQLSVLMQEKITPVLYSRMEQSGYPMIPYVNTRRGTPESGLVDFLETPRYSSGYAALHHTIGFMPETHMWKPYEERVASTYELLKNLVDVMVEHREELMRTRKEVKEAVRHQEYFPITWTLDTTRVDTIRFLGYEIGNKKSKVTGMNRMYYDRNKPTDIRIPYYNHYRDGLRIRKPKAYILPQAYDKVVDLLLLNGTKMQRLSQDTTIMVEMYYITDYKTSNTPYEGHYLHHSVELKPVMMERTFYQGDWLIPMDQTANRYIIETLEPQAPDSFFNWNFFDAILSQKEYFSPYIFEEKAWRLLEKNPQWKVELDHAKQQNPDLASNGRAQLDWIYKKSPYYEDTHNLYPIGRVVD